MIEVRNLTKYYGKDPAVLDISFDVKQGEILGFLGPNAAGKTTTMRIITGYLRPTAGTIKVADYNVTENPIEVKKKIGYLAEDNPLYYDLTPKEFLGFVAEVRNIKGNELKDAMERAIETAGLSEVLNKPIGELSKGFRQRVGIAQALLHNPPIFILDEPTTGLDPAQIVEIRELIKKLGKEKTVVLSTHILPEVQMLCERVIIIHKGKIVLEGKPDELSMRIKPGINVLFVLKGEGVENKLKERKDIISFKCSKEGEYVKGSVVFKENGDPREKFFNFVVENNWKLIELNLEKATLEDIFIELTAKE